MGTVAKPSPKKTLSVVHIDGIGPRVTATSINRMLGRDGDTIDGMALLTVKSACRVLNCGRSTLYRLLAPERDEAPKAA
jgi:hypothetical protein